MTQGLRELTSQELNVALESVLLPRFAAVLGKREAGHCMRVTDLDRDLMVRLCGGLRSLVPGATVVVLADEALRQSAPNIAVSSTKLVELRNPLPNDELRTPLLVFVPNDLRASAEDSFGVATFEEISIDGAYGDLVSRLLASVPAPIKGAVEVLLEDLQREGRAWRFADEASVARFLLTAQLNDFDAQAIEPARPVVGGAAGFHDDQRDFAVREPALELRARQAMRFDDMPLAIGHGQLENVLGKIDSDGSSIHFGFPFGVERC